MKRRDFLTVSATAALGLASGARPAHANALTMPAEHRFARANYIPGAPLRDTVGEGKIIRGQVLSLETGEPVPGSEIEYWLNTTPDAGGIGEQNPANRGKVVADENGRFRFETNPP